jgi:hypothetical protein
VSTGELLDLGEGTYQFRGREFSVMSIVPGGTLSWTRDYATVFALAVPAGARSAVIEVNGRFVNGNTRGTQYVDMGIDLQFLGFQGSQARVLKRDLLTLLRPTTLLQLPAERIFDGFGLEVRFWVDGTAGEAMGARTPTMETVVADCGFSDAVAAASVVATIRGAAKRPEPRVRLPEATF